MMKAYIFTEAGEGIGFGHLSRCISLYQALLETKVEPEIIVYGTFHNASMLEGVHYCQQSWYEESFLKSTVTSEDFCIIDSYLAPPSIYQFLSQRAKRCIYIDDNARLDYPPGVVVNPSLYVGNLYYRKNPGVTYLYGPSYVIVRSSFQGLSEKKSVPSKVKDVLITMGGTDPKRMTLPLIEMMQTSFPAVRVHVLITDAFLDKEEIELKVSDKLCIYKNLNAEEMKDVIQNVELAITAAGQTVYELMATSTPFVPIQTVANQDNNVEGLRIYGLRTIYIEETEQIDYVEEELMKYVSEEMRTSLIKSYSHLIDGNGSKRIASKLIHGMGEV